MARRSKKNAAQADIIIAISCILLIFSFRNSDAVIGFLSFLFKATLILGISGGALYLTFRLSKNRKMRPSPDRLRAFIREPAHRPSSYKHQINRADIAYESVMGATIKETEPQLTERTLQEMDWKRFELLCRDYFLAKKYKASLTPPGADGGVFQDSCPDKLVLGCYFHAAYSL